MGLASAEDFLTPDARMIAGKVDFPGGRRLLVVSAYLQCSIGLKDANLEILQSIGEARAKTSWL